MAGLKRWALGMASKASNGVVTERQVGDAAVLGVEGNIITGDNAAALRDIIRRLLAEGRNKILLDVSSVRWIDSAGLGTLAASMASAAREGGQIKLLKARGSVKDLLSATRLDTVFATYDEESEAINDFL